MPIDRVSSPENLAAFNCCKQQAQAAQSAPALQLYIVTRLRNGHQDRAT